MSGRKRNVGAAPSRMLYTPPADVVSPEVWRPKLSEAAKARRKTCPQGLVTRAAYRRSTAVKFTVNSFELAKLAELEAALVGRSTSYGLVEDRAGVLRWLIKSAHLRLVEGRLFQVRKTRRPSSPEQSRRRS